MSIKRYDVDTINHHGAEMCASRNGDYVLFEDYERELWEANEKIESLESTIEKARDILG